VTPVLIVALIFLVPYALFAIALITAAVWSTWETRKRDEAMRFRSRK
jgi:hypothetical protein